MVLTDYYNWLEKIQVGDRVSVVWGNTNLLRTEVVVRQTAVFYILKGGSFYKASGFLRKGVSGQNTLYRIYPVDVDVEKLLQRNKIIEKFLRRGTWVDLSIDKLQEIDNIINR